MIIEGTHAEICALLTKAIGASIEDFHVVSLPTPILGRLYLMRPWADQEDVLTPMRRLGEALDTVDATLYGEDLSTMLRLDRPFPRSFSRLITKPVAEALLSKLPEAQLWFQWLTDEDVAALTLAR